MEEFQKHSQTSTDLPFRTSQRSSPELSAVCIDCNKQHDPRRLVICVDGTWYNENGSIVDPSDTSNVHRIWQLLPRETVFQDSCGQIWQQERMHYVSGVGVHTGLRYTTASIVAAVTGDGDTGCSVKIKEVYEKCCSLCPSRDEIFMFGYSRGAFVVRAVAGMLQHLGSLRTNGTDFNRTFDEALKVWQDLRKGGNSNNKVESFRTQYTRESPIIRFMGVFDTVQAYNDSGLNDIRHLDNVYNVRHAMAMFERRAQFKLERFVDGTSTRCRGSNRTCQEAWFIGTHGNLGGACKEDGLALWPLQWILAEAQKFGLKLRFTATPGSSVKNPSHLVFPWLSNSSSFTVPNVHDRMTHISYSNHISVPFYDLTNSFNEPGFKPEIAAGSKIWMRFAERQIFETDGSLTDTVNSPQKSSGVFIHPSVYWMDSKRSDIIRGINISPLAKQIRDSVSTVLKDDQRHWNVTDEITQVQEPKKPRILVCGESGVGKSSLINAVLHKEVTGIEEGSYSGIHDINEPLGAETDRLVLHDSQGWKHGEAANFRTIQEFLKERRQAHLIQDQLHCVWFCSSSTQPRITQTDIDFLNLDFGQVPVLLITTKQDSLHDDVVSRILTKFYRQFRTGNLLELPSGKREEATARIQQEEQTTMDKIKREWLDHVHRHVPKENQLELTFEFFTTRVPRVDDSIPELTRASGRAMTSDRIRQIHSEAQKNWIDNVLNKAIDQLVNYWGDKRKTLELIGRDGDLKLFVKEAIKMTNKVFQYDKFKEKHHPDHILNLLEYTDVERGIWSLVYSGLKGMAGTIALFSGPVLRTLAAGMYSLSAINRARENALSLIPELVHVLLIFERIYWYHGGEINDLFIEGSCYYYLKIQADVIKRVNEIEGWQMFTAQIRLEWEKSIVRDVLRTVVNEFRFKHSHRESETQGPKALGSIPGSFIGGGI